MNIYLASSWRNYSQPGILLMLRSCGHTVYDFKNPSPGNVGFSWKEIDPEWKSWTPAQYRDALKHPIAKQGYHADMTALQNCDMCVLLLPSGRSASWEFGFAAGQGKKTAVIMFEACEPELMYRLSPIITNTDEFFEFFGEPTHTKEKA